MSLGCNYCPMTIWKLKLHYFVKKNKKTKKIHNATTMLGTTPFIFQQ
jgi:hypothetical protein